MATTQTTPEQGLIDRRRAIAMALQQASMQPLQSPQVRGARVSPLEGVNKIVQSLMASRQNAQLDQEQSALTGQQDAAQAQRMKALVAALAAQGTDPAKAQTIAESLTAGDPGANIGLQSILPQAPPADFTLSPGQERFSGANGGQVAAVPVTPPTPAAPAPFTLSPGQQRFDPSGQPVASVPAPVPPAKTDMSVTPFEAWRQENPTGKIEDWIKLNEKAAASAKVGTRAVNTVDASGKEVTRIVPDVAGTEYTSPPTSTQQDKAAALKNIDPILDSISTLSEKINTGKGLEAKAAGEAAKLAARANYNDDVAEYQAIISGFTPMIARAVGHTGVLTQQDVDSVKELFPKPGDSKTLRDRKIARVRSILSGPQGSTAPAAPSGGTSKAPAGLDPAVWNVMTPEERKLWK